MNKLLILVFLYYCGIFSGQIISGTTISENQKPLSGVNVYIDGSKIVTVSDSGGNFSLDIQHQKNATLVFQKNGYQTATLKISDAVGKKLKVTLLRIQDIEEVVIVPYTDAAYKKYINYFLTQFVGFDSRNVKIKNQKTLKFSFDQNNQILRVKAPETLMIENKNLAYQIQFTLMNFEADFKNNTTSYSGTSYFKEINPKPINQVNRLNAYHGSIMHFLRSAFRDEISKEGFWVNHIVKMEKSKIAPGQNILAQIATQIPTSAFIETAGEHQFITFENILQVNYPKYYFELRKSKITKSTTAVPQISYIYMNGDSFEIFKDGNSSDPESMILQGNLSNNKMERFLPLDYQPELK